MRLFKVYNFFRRTLGETKVGNTHSSQDSLSSSRKASREYDSAFTSRRPSKEVTDDQFPSNSRRSSRGSESIADTIKDIENRVAYMSDIVTRHTEEKLMKTNNVDDERWSTLEKKYIFKDQQDQSNERPKGKQPSNCSTNGLFCNPLTHQKQPLFIVQFKMIISCT